MSKKAIGMVMGMAATLTPKARRHDPPPSPSPPPAPPFDRQAILDALFALPVPTRGEGRQFPIHTPLGRLMVHRGLRVRDMDAMPGCPNYRLLSDYLAGRQEIAPRYRQAIARALGVDPRLL